MQNIRVALKENSYDIVIGRDSIRSLPIFIDKLGMPESAVIITNKKVARLHGYLIKQAMPRHCKACHFIFVQDSEKAKSFSSYMGVISRLASYGKKRSPFIIAFGGGVVGDLAGFVASTFKRGVPFIQIPTTLLAQVDSAIGGKVGIDLPSAKNMVGSFYQPKIVISDISFLNTLPIRQLRNGLSEVVKYGMICDKELFSFLEKKCIKILSLDRSAMQHIVAESSRTKAAIVSKDEFERKGFRTILNFGHTMGHAIESASSYSGKYQHGEAVAIGMIIASRISQAMKLISGSDVDRLEHLLKRLGLPVRARGVKYRTIYEAHLHDKKFTQRSNRFVLPTAVGSARTVEDVPDELIKRTLSAHIER